MKNTANHSLSLAAGKSQTRLLWQSLIRPVSKRQLSKRPLKITFREFLPIIIPTFLFTVCIYCCVMEAITFPVR